MLCVLFATSFHSSGMVGILFLLVYYLLNIVNDNAKILVALPNRKISLKVTITALVTILLPFLFLNTQVISTLLNSIGRSDYVAGYMKNGIGFSLIRLLNVLPMVLLYIFRNRTIQKDARYFLQLLCLVAWLWHSLVLLPLMVVEFLIFSLCIMYTLCHCSPKIASL